MSIVRVTQLTALTVLLPSCFGAQLLLRSQQKPSITAVQTWAGTREVRTIPVQPAKGVTVLVIADAVSPERAESIASGINAVWTSLHQTSAVRLAILQGGAMQLVGPFETRTKLQSALRDLKNILAKRGEPADPSIWVDALVAGAPQLGGNWSAVVLAGDLPVLDQPVAEYAIALLFRTFTQQKLSVSWLGTPGDNFGSWRPLFTETGGVMLSELSAFPSQLTDSSWSYFEEEWDAAALKAGFEMAHAVLAGDATLPPVPDLTLSSEARLPTIASWVELRRLAAGATSLASTKAFSQADLDQFPTTLERALAINSRDPETLRAGASLYSRAKDFKTAAGLLARLAEVAPTDADVFGEMGQDLFADGQFKLAEEALLRARELGAKTPRGAESLARIHIERKDDAGALPFLSELLTEQPNRPEIWFMQGEVAQRVDQRELLFNSWERGLSLDAGNIRYRSALIRAYMDANRRKDCLRHIEIVMTAPPPDVAIRVTYAEFLDRLNVNPGALAAWRRVLELDAKHESAWYRVGRLSLTAGNAAAAIEASEAGIEAHADSARLYLLKADALAVQGEIYRARATLAEAKAKVKDLDLYRRAAADEEGFSGSAATAMRDYAELLSASRPASDELARAMRRGLEVSVRENDTKQAGWFTAHLRDAGLGSFVSQYVQADRGTLPIMMLPGGIDALAFIARAGEHTTPEHFLADYCQTIANYTGALGPKADREYLDEIQNYFKKLAELESFGRRDKNQAVVVLSTRDKRSRQSAEKVLALLGLRLRSSHGEVTVEELTKGARKQDLAGALGVDGGSISKSFAQGKDFRIEIPYEAVPIWPDEKLWRETFYDKQTPYGGLAEAVTKLPRLAQLYKALSVLDRPALDALLRAFSLKILYDKHLDLMAQYAATFSVQDGRAVVPGGVESESLWNTLTGASPRQAPLFFRALLEKDDGKMLAFFFALSQLDPLHQRFFTLNAARARQFYQLFTESAEGHKTAVVTRNTSFTDFLRDIPLDGNGHVDFPGSAEVWMVAEGGSSSEHKTAKLLKRLSRAVAPDEEDKVLMRLAKTRYHEKAESLTEIDNFLAVSRIDAHRSEPLDEDAALLLAQHYSAWKAAYPYFTTLTGVNAGQLRSFFTALSKLKEEKNTAVNPVVGEFHALIQLLCLLQRRGELSEPEAATLFGGISERFASAGNQAAIATAAASSIGEILSHCRHAAGAGGPDQQIRAVLLGDPHPIQAGFGERAPTVDPVSLRYHDFDRVLEMQKVPALGPLLVISQLAVTMQGDRIPTPVQIRTLQDAVARIPSLTPGKELKLEGRDKDGLREYETVSLAKLVSQVVQKADKKKPNPKDFQKLGEDLLAEEQPQFTLALSGLIYAWYLRPVDLPVAEDALLLRKHRFYDVSPAARASALNQPSSFQVDSGGAGSYFSGGFAAFGSAAGQAAAVGMKAGKGVPSSVIGAQIVAVRDIDWARLGEADQRLFNLRAQLGREWITVSAAQPASLTRLSQQTAGLLAPARRSELLNAIAASSWPRVWSTVTLSDLYRLGLRCSMACDAGVMQSPVAVLLKQASSRSDGHNLDLLGPVPLNLYGCSHPHLLQAAPYEEYARHMFPTDIAERSAEFKLQLILAGDQSGIAPAALGTVAEALLRDVLAKTEMSTSSDWRSLLNSCAWVDGQRLREKLASQ